MARLGLSVTVGVWMSGGIVAGLRPGVSMWGWLGEAPIFMSARFAIWGGDVGMYVELGGGKLLAGKLYDCKLGGCCCSLFDTL